MPLYSEFNGFLIVNRRAEKKQRRPETSLLRELDKNRPGQNANESPRKRPLIERGNLIF